MVALPVLLFSSFSSSPCFANIPPAQQEAGSANQEAFTPQAKFIQSLGDRAIALLANKDIPPEERDAQFRNILRDSFDLQTIARFVIGRSWITATPEQQKEYVDLFEALVVKTYSDRFALYTGEGFKVVNSVPETDKDTIVNSQITRPDGSPSTSVTWRVRTKGEKMGIIDVVVEGVSMSLTQRQEYSSVIQRNGGDVSALLDLMRKRVAEHPADVKKKG
jgi:phospholipid transport system substrate-binding protein